MSVSAFISKPQHLITSSLSRVDAPLRHHIHTIWLFTSSDIKTIIIPATFSGLAFAHTGQLSSEAQKSIKDLLARLPWVLFWVWINLLPSVIGNQSTATGVLEDSLNKPWRPVPSGRVSPTQAYWIMAGLYPTAFMASVYVGAMEPCTTLMILAFLYNHSGLGDSSAWAKNLINACGYCCFVSGAAIVASGGTIATISSKGMLWILTIWAIIFSTVHIQDLQDVEGDAAKGRQTVPLVVGDTLTRVSIAVAVILWSIATPLLWTRSLVIISTLFCLGTSVATRVWLYRTVQDDKLTFKIWNVWMTFLFLVPALDM